MSLKHAFVSAVADGVDATIIQPQAHWNAEHAFTGGALGSILYRDAGGTGGASWLDDVAAGSVLVSGGIAAAPAWSASPTLTGLTIGSINFSGTLSGPQFTATGSGGFSAPAGGFFSVAARGFWSATADGVWMIQNAAGTAFTRMMFGGSTSSFPALTRNGAVLESKLADNSAYAQHNGLLFAVVDGIAAPGATVGIAKIYVDTADGDLKVVFGDGVVKTIVVDT